MEMRKRKEGKSLSKTGRCHGFSEVYESSCWGQSLPLLKENILSLGGAGRGVPGDGSRQRLPGARGPQLLHRHCQGSGAGWLQVRASHSALLSGLSK